MKSTSSTAWPIGERLVGGAGGGRRIGCDGNRRFRDVADVVGAAFVVAVVVADVADVAADAAAAV